MLEDQSFTKMTVGELAWLSLLRPDIAFAVHRLSLSFAKPTEEAEEQLRSLMKYIAGTQTYTISLQIPRRWERAKNLELLAFSTSWVQDSRAATCVSLSFMGVHLGASIQQATTKAAAEFNTVRLASTLAFHTQSLLREMMLEKPLCFRVLTRGPVPQKLGLSKQTRHIDLWSQLGQFQLSKVQPQQNLAEQLANNLRACDLHRLLPKLQLQARSARELALPTVQCEGRAFVSSLGSFFIGQLCCAPAMEKPQLLQELSGKELGKNLEIPDLQSALAKNSLLTDELAAAYSKGSLQHQSLQQRKLAAAYDSDLDDQHQSLQEKELSAAYAQDQLQCLDLPELEKTALHTELVGFKPFKPQSSTRACDPQLDAYIGSTRASASQHVASTSFPRASRKQLRDRKVRIFPSLVRFIVNLLVHSLILHSLSFLFSTSSLNWTSLSLPSSLLNCWAHELSAQNELLTTFGSHKLMHNELTRTGGGEEIAKTLELANLLWDHELEELLTTKSFQLDQPQQQQQDQLEKQLWSIQLQQNLSENELDKNKKKKNKKKLQTNKKFSEKNFQSLILEKLVALMPEKHFALAASSRLLGNEAWEEHREASKETSFDKVGDKELLQEELRREELGCKDLRPACFRALCPTSFEENSFTEETFANTSLGKETFKESSLTTSSFTSSSLTKSSFTESSLTENSFAENTFLKNSFSRTALTRRASQQHL